MRVRLLAAFYLPAVLLVVIFPVLLGAAEEPPATAPPSVPTPPSAPAPPSAPPGAWSPGGASGGGWFGRDISLSVPPFVDKFPGVDLSKLSAPLLERFIQRANTEMCTCGLTGCPRHTLAFCSKVDPKCPRAKNLLRRMAAEILSQAQLAAHPSVAPPIKGKD